MRNCVRSEARGTLTCRERAVLPAATLVCGESTLVNSVISTTSIVTLEGTWSVGAGWYASLLDNGQLFIPTGFLAARARYDRTLAATDNALLTAREPTGGTTELLITNTDHDAITAELIKTEAELDAAQRAHRAIKARLPLDEVHPGQKVLDTETKLLTHAIRMAAFRTVTALARDIRLHTGYARANDEAHALIRGALTGSGDLIPGENTLTIRLDPQPTPRATAAIKELCQHLTAMKTCYPGTDLTLHYDIKPHQ